MARVLVPLAEGFEEIEATTIVDVLRRGGVEVVLAGLDGAGPCRGSRGIVVLPDVDFDGAEGPWDLVVLPGGQGGTLRQLAHDGLGKLLAARLAASEPVAAICAAPLVLDALGALDAVPFTCHPSVTAQLNGTDRVDGPVVDAGLIITSTAAGTAMHFALHLVERLVSAEVRGQVEQGLQWSAAAQSF